MAVAFGSSFATDAGSSSSLSGCSISRLFASTLVSCSGSILGEGAGDESGENPSLKADFGSILSTDLVTVGVW